MTLPNPNCAPKNATAFGTVILPDAIGLSFVLSTLASTFLSQMSLTVHPAPRSNTAPAENKAVMAAISSVAGGIAAVDEESKIDHKHG